MLVKVMLNRFRHFFLIICYCVPLVSCVEIVDDYFSYSGSYTALGDSITYGKGSLFSKSWTDIIKERMHINEYENLAVCGAVASSRYGDLQYDLITQINKVNPETDLITIMIGINDCLLDKEIGDVEREILLSTDELCYSKSFTQGLIYCLRVIRDRAPHAIIVLVSPPSISYEVKRDLSEYVASEKEIAYAYNIPFIDLLGSGYSSTDRKLCNSDLIHPTDEGYQVIASYVFPRLWSILGN